MNSNENAKANPKKLGKLRGCALILFGLTIIILIFGIISGESEDGQGQQEEPQKKQEPVIKYKTVQMPDGKIWFAENLNEAIGNSPCYENKKENCKKCGRLYDWETAMKACPNGWHLPSQEEWENLKNTIGGRETAGGYLKSKSGWDPSSDGFSGNGTDKYGFSVIACGYDYSSPDNERFLQYGISAGFWSATAAKEASFLYDDPTTAAIRIVFSNSKNSGNTMGIYLDGRSARQSVHCVKDN